MEDGLLDSLDPVRLAQLRIRLKRVFAVVGENVEAVVIVRRGLSCECMLEIDRLDGIVHVL